jgi:hypothetical protein
MRAARQALCAVLWMAVLWIPASGREATLVAPLEFVTPVLHVLVAAKACNFAVDQEALNRYLADHGVNALQLSSAGLERLFRFEGWRQLTGPAPAGKLRLGKNK